MTAESTVLPGCDLSTTYLGLQLRSPLVASSGPLTSRIDSLRALEQAGIAAVVLPSLFEEQVDHDDIGAKLFGRVHDLGAIVEHFEQLYLRLHTQEVPDVLAYLRNVFRNKQANRDRRSHGPTISSWRGGSPPPTRYEDGPFVIGSHCFQVVVACHDLHDESGRLSDRAEVAGVEQPQAILA